MLLGILIGSSHCLPCCDWSEYYYSIRHSFENRAIVATMVSKCGLGSNPAMMLCVDWGFWFCTLLQEVFSPRYYGFRLSPKTNAWFLLKWRVEHLCSANSPKAKGWIDDDHFYFCYHYCCVQENTYYLRRFSVPRVLRCPAGIDLGC